MAGLSFGRISYWLARPSPIYPMGPRFRKEVLKNKQKTREPPDSIPSFCGENDVEAYPKAKDISLQMYCEVAFFAQAVILALERSFLSSSVISECYNNSNVRHVRSSFIASDDDDIDFAMVCQIYKSTNGLSGKDAATDVSVHWRNVY
ncbi:hypothetical protein HYC85_031984 [Camellia sinensis]|uniref:Uncharacterized protein n=1 Tax=Camellia sinensis TaxID=4442 RepID=A0A7J7FSX5_CAMSI|nr:hypothetical protein HYC85_031984 [Camellia sinensis]